MSIPSRSRYNRSIMIIVIFQIVLGLAYLKTVPRLFHDDMWSSVYGYSLVHSGAMRAEFTEGFGGINIYMVQPCVIQPLVCGIIFKFAGYSIMTARVDSLIFGVIAVISLYGIMRRWFGENQAIWTVVATILHPWFFEISRRARPEIYFTALSLAALWCVVYWLDSKARHAALLAGVLAGLAGLAHPSGVVLDFVIGCAVLIWLRTERIWRLILWSSMGFLIAILPYIIYVLWATQDPRVSFLGQMKVAYYHRELLLGELTRWQSFLQLPKGIPLAAIMIASWLVAWYRSGSADKVLATIVGLFAVLIPFASVNTAGRYLAVLTPFFCALMVRLVWRNATNYGVLLENWRKLRLFVSVGIVVIYLLMCVTGVSLMFYHLRGADFDKVLNQISSVVEQGKSVYGEKLLWLGHDHFSYGPFPEDYSVAPPRQTVEMVRKHHFDYAVRSAWSFETSHGIAQPPANMPDFRADNVIDQVCKQFGIKIYEFYDQYFGPFEIYKLNWDNKPNLEMEQTGTEFNYGLPMSVRHLIDKPVNNEVTYSDVICFLQSKVFNLGTPYRGKRNVTFY